ncbi:unnamed protein product [Closterium sp. Yama58-4]|nr:unnamed protein product [Closterium sp. Yama58-4]
MCTLTFSARRVGAYLHVATVGILVFVHRATAGYVAGIAPTAPPLSHRCLGAPEWALCFALIARGSGQDACASGRSSEVDELGHRLGASRLISIGRIQARIVGFLVRRGRLLRPALLRRSEETIFTSDGRFIISFKWRQTPWLFSTGRIQAQSLLYAVLPLDDPFLVVRICFSRRTAQGARRTAHQHVARHSPLEDRSSWLSGDNLSSHVGLLHPSHALEDRGIRRTGA